VSSQETGTVATSAAPDPQAQAQAKLQEQEQERAAVLAELGTPAGAADPYPLYARLRALGPVLPSPGSGVYLTGYEQCQAVIRNTTGFHAQNATWMDRVRPGWREHPGLVATTDSFLFKDPPEHTRLRRLVAGAFTQRQAGVLREHIGGLAERVLDLVADAGADGSTVDLHEILAATLPISVVGHVLGVPEEDHPILREPLEGLRLSVDGSNRASNLEAIDRGGSALVEYFGALAAKRRVDPRDDVVTALASATGRALTEDELQQTLTLIFSAGIESMVDMLLNGLGALLAHPDQLAAVRADPGLMPGAIEEMLRYDTPVQAMGRVTAGDTEIGGVPVAAGRLVLIMLGAAHRDPAAFPDPDRFDVTRDGAAVLSFGAGVHHCLGAPLARMQAAVFFPALLARFPGLRPAGAPVRRGFVLRGFSDFPVALR
jgi:cytochrome P450